MPDDVKGPAEHNDADGGGADDEGVAEEVPQDAGHRAEHAVLLKLHLDRRSKIQDPKIQYPSKKDPKKIEEMTLTS